MSSTGSARDVLVVEVRFLKNNFALLKTVKVL